MAYLSCCVQKKSCPRFSVRRATDLSRREALGIKNFPSDQFSQVPPRLLIILFSLPKTQYRSQINFTEKTLTKAGNCFVAGTEILTVDGIKSIEDIQVGDWVIADDPTTPGGIEAKQVLETFVRETDALVDLYVDGEVISTTGEHPFWVADKGWVEAKDLGNCSTPLTRRQDRH